MARRQAHRPDSRVVHAVTVTHEGLAPEAITACGISLGHDYTEADHLPVTCRRCRRTPAAH